MRILCIGMAWTLTTGHERYLQPQLSSNTIGIFGFFLASYILTLPSHLTVVSGTSTRTDGYNKLFTHNRTSTRFHDAEDNSFLTRLRDLTAAAKNPGRKQQQSNRWSGTNGLPIPAKLKGNKHKKQPHYIQQNGSGGKNKKNKGNVNNGRKPKPSSNKQKQNPNHNYYSSSYAIPKYPVEGAVTVMTAVFTPTVTPTRIHPLTIFKTEIKETGPEGAINYGRSALDLLGTEQEGDQEGGSSEVKTGPAAPATASDTNFFKNFRDHSEDPMAEESGSPALAYAHPMSSIQAPSAPQFEHQVKEHTQYSEIYHTGYNDEGGQGQGQNYPDHKNVNYWPHILNGDEYLSQIRPNKKRAGPAGPRPRYPGRPTPHHQPHLVNSFEEFGNEAAVSVNSNALRKLTMIDRISTIYTDYKFLAWVGIVVAVSLAALFGLLALYFRNPPTEVVTARDNLSRTLTDPTLLIFVSEALRKFGDSDNDKEKIDEKSGERGTNQFKRRRQKKTL